MAIVAEATDAVTFDAAPPDSVARAVFALGDLARQTTQERWVDPGEGLAAYSRAGRVDAVAR